jgi:hypothetical protein
MEKVRVIGAILVLSTTVLLALLLLLPISKKEHFDSDIYKTADGFIKSFPSKKKTSVTSGPSPGPSV